MTEDSVDNNRLDRLQSQAPMSNWPSMIAIMLLAGGWIFLYLDMYILSKLGLFLFVGTIVRFLDVIGRELAIRELISLLMLLQMIASPLAKYHYLDNIYMYTMDIGEEMYMSFVFWAVALFILGLYLFPEKTPRKIGEFSRLIGLKSAQNANVGVVLIFAGFVAHYSMAFVPNSLQFVFILLSSLRFIGCYYLLFSNSKFKFIWVLIVYGSYVYLVIGGGLFIHIFIWGLFLFVIVCVKYKLSFLVKSAVLVAGFLLAFFIQSFKGDYRKVVWDDKRSSEYSINMGGVESSKQEVFLEMAAEQSQDTDQLYKKENIHKFVDRLNQGWILTLVFNQVPRYEQFTGGKMLLEDLQAALLPRFLSPLKRTSGGAYGREKFMQYTGKYLVEGTRMTIGIFGDAFVNFGFYGGIVFMFFFGLFLNLILKYIYSLSQNIYPSLMLWIPFIFLYSMRSGNEILIILNHIVKSSFVVFVIFFLFRSSFRSAKILDRTK